MAERAANNDYLLVYPGGKRERLPGERFHQRLRDGKIPKGTAVYHPAGWYVVGATVGDIFSD